VEEPLRARRNHGNRHRATPTTQPWYVKQVPELVTEAIQRRADEGIFVDGHPRTPNHALMGHTETAN